MIMAKGLDFRPLTKDDVDVRVGILKNNGATYLLYKNARVDMHILDEVCGEFGWQREHKELKGVIYCGVSIKNPDGEWITKWDAGTESNTEKEKGEASDSFKRACFNWGIGRELYTAPFIWISLTPEEVEKKGNIGLKVSHMMVVDGKVTQLEIVDRKGNVRWTTGGQFAPMVKTAPKAKKVTAPTISVEEFRAKWYGTEYSVTNDDCADAAKAWGLTRNPRIMRVDDVVEMVLDHAKIKGEQGIENQRQDLIVSVESAESEDALKALYNANEAIIDESIRAKFTARKNIINNSKTA